MHKNLSFFYKSQVAKRDYKKHGQRKKYNWWMKIFVCVNFNYADNWGNVFGFLFSLLNFFFLGRTCFYPGAKI